MTRILADLGQDHRNLSVVLQVLDRQLALLRGGGDGDYELIEAALDYCVSYADAWHHPTEDLVYGLLERKAGTVGELSRELHQDHEALGKLTAEFHDMVEDVLGGGVLTRDALLEVADHFMREYRDHMLFEERFLFPAARESITAHQWTEIEEQCARIVDPLFGEETAARFETLREHITALERASVPPSRS